MLVRYARNELRGNWGTHLAVFIVLALSACLMATGATVMERMTAAVNGLFEVAKPPHFLQMHTGEYDRAALQKFAAEHPEIEDWLIEDMIGFEGKALSWEDPATGETGKFSESLIDNLFVVQNETFDFLIDEQGSAPNPSEGHVYVPVAYQQQFDLEPGDTLTVHTEEGDESFEIEGFVKDAQMASSLSSATRFLISPTDFAMLSEAGGGTPEIIVEYLAVDPSSAGALQTAYEATPGLPMNGPGVTYDLIRAINVLSEGLSALALMLVSLAFVVIALISIRFIVRTTLQDRVREIGVMRAIGISHRTISQLFVATYGVVVLLACVVGGALALPVSRIMARGINQHFSEPSFTVWSVLAPASSLLVVILLVLGSVWLVLRAVKRINVVSALVHGSTLTEAQTAKRARRSPGGTLTSAFRGFRGRGLPLWLSLTEIRTGARGWALIPLVFALATVLVALPMSLLNTFQSPQFVRYLGAPVSDVRIDVQDDTNPQSTFERIRAELRDDERVTDFSSYAIATYEIDSESGWERLHTEVGDYSGGTVAYAKGEAPIEGQIALSALNAQHFGVSVGDRLTVRDGDELLGLEVSGLYQDVTAGGRTAKMADELPGDAEGYVVYLSLAKGVDAQELSQLYSERFSAAQVYPMEDYVQQTLSHVVNALSVAVWISISLTVAVMALITYLYLILHLARTTRRHGVLSALGFSGNDLAVQMRLTSTSMIVTGVVIGLVLAATVGEAVVGTAMSLTGLGLTALRLFPSPALVYGAIPALIVAVGAVTAYFVSLRLRAVDASRWFRE